MSTCLDALHAFAEKAFANWRGLPAPCRISDAWQVFAPQDEWTGAGQMGLNSVAANYRFCNVPSYAAPVRVWFVDSEIRLLEAEGPVKGLAFERLAELLGEPEARLDTYFGFAAVPEGEWVYAGRGIAFSGDSGLREIHRLWVFVPTTLDGYRQYLRLSLRQTPLPRAKWN